MMASMLILNIIEASVFLSERNYLNTLAYKADEGQMACLNNFKLIADSTEPHLQNITYD